jgi:hypothetical protein
MVKLQGVSWDILSEGQVWPALVFEKTQHGDLRRFMYSPIGKGLLFSDMLKLCADITVAVMGMHSQRKLTMAVF